VGARARTQFSYYALGPPPPLLLAAPYDQFLSRDADQITTDEAGFAAYVDARTGLTLGPVWQPGAALLPGQERPGPDEQQQRHAPAQQLLCDARMQPYSAAFQEAYRAGRVLQYVASGVAVRAPARAGLGALRTARVCVGWLGGAPDPRVQRCSSAVARHQSAAEKHTTHTTHTHTPVPGADAVLTLRGSTMQLPPSLELFPPTFSAAVWAALEARAAQLSARRGHVPSEEHVIVSQLRAHAWRRVVRALLWLLQLAVVASRD
jgi:hypothetical protein